MRKPIVAALAVGMGLILGCSKARNDETIMTDIKAALFSDSQTKRADVDVTVKDGTATLVGQVPDENTRYEAFKIAKQTAGVVNVLDQMTLPQPPVAEAGKIASKAASAANSASAPKSARELRRERDSLPVRPLAGSGNGSSYSSNTQAQNAPQQEAEASPSAPMSNAPPSTPAAAPEPAPAPAAPAPPAVRQVSIPAGTPVHIQMIDSVDSATNHAGDVFRASLAFPIVVNGEPIVPTGTDVFVKLTNSSSAGRMTGRSELTLQLARLDFQGKSYSLSSDDYKDVGKSRGKRTAETVGIGAAVGAAIGGIFGGGKGAAIGAGVGGGGGAAAEAATKGQQIRIASETKLDFNLQQPVDVTYSPDKNSSNR
jgi:BON domain-containing protein